MLKWFAIPFSSGSQFVRTLHHDHLFWVDLHGMAQRFIQLDKAVIHVISLVSFMWLWFSFCLPSVDEDKRSVYAPGTLVNVLSYLRLSHSQWENKIQFQICETKVQTEPEFGQWVEVKVNLQDLFHNQLQVSLMVNLYDFTPVMIRAII